MKTLPNLCSVSKMDIGHTQKRHEINPMLMSDNCIETIDRLKAKVM